MPDWALARRTTNYEFHLHPPVDYEIHYKVDQYVLIHAFTGGEARGALGNEPMRPRSFGAGSTRLITPGTRVRTVQSRPLEFLVIGIDPDSFGAAANSVTGTCAWRVRNMDNIMDPGLAALCGETRRSMIADPPGQEAYLAMLANAIVARIVLRHLETDVDVPGPEMLAPSLARRLANEIEEGLEETIRVQDLAARVGLSRAHFTRAFARSFGTPPRDYILSRRIARARAMLTDTDLSATQIAMRCGFANPSHLTTSFRKEIGLTPTDYRRALTQG